MQDKFTTKPFQAHKLKHSHKTIHTHPSHPSLKNSSFMLINSSQLKKKKKQTKMFMPEINKCAMKWKDETNKQKKTKIDTKKKTSAREI